MARPPAYLARAGAHVLSGLLVLSAATVAVLATADSTADPSLLRSSVRWSVDRALPYAVGAAVIVFAGAVIATVA